jgi:hypothetical protein
VTERGDRVILRSVKVNRRETLRDLTNIVNERLPWPVSARTVRNLTNVVKVASLPSNDFLSFDPQLYTVKIFDILMTVNYIKYEREIGCFNN